MCARMYLRVLLHVCECPCVTRALHPDSKGQGVCGSAGPNGVNHRFRLTDELACLSLTLSLPLSHTHTHPSSQDRTPSLSGCPSFTPSSRLSALFFCPPFLFRLFFLSPLPTRVYVSSSPLLCQPPLPHNLFACFSLLAFQPVFPSPSSISNLCLLCSLTAELVYLFFSCTQHSTYCSSWRWHKFPMYFFFSEAP